MPASRRTLHRQAVGGFGPGPGSSSVPRHPLRLSSLIAYFCHLLRSESYGSPRVNGFPERIYNETLEASRFMHSNSVVSGSKLISTAFDRMTHLDRLTDGELGDLVRVAFKLGLRTGLLQREPTDLRTVLAALHVAPVRDGSDLNALTLRQQLYAVFRSGFAVGATQWRIQEAVERF